ncbi:histidine phosphatase family protein [Deinococcus sp. 6YEL10]|uniref:histidine phosphatase family protein n=1 Tax=Deinococcus sp. 6YEL10 TaxID=2745870 RepID=UPI001E453C91|nr:histidine phosphatase family protein [Deinococcus sp. 6YEL10]
MPDALTLHLVRHAPTLPNAQRRYPHPHEDAPLTPAGEALARALDLPRSALAFTSPLGRARQTARLAGFPHAEATPALAEASFGVMSGHTWAELEAQYGEAPRAWIEALSDPASPHGPPGGDTGQSFHTRVQAWLDTLPAGEGVAFTHAGPLLAALRLTVNLSAVATPPGTVATLRREGGHWWLTALRPPA